MGMPGAGLTGALDGKAPSEMSALEPYWGKPAVRNLRGDDGNVGIIRSPVRAIVPPDRRLEEARRAGGGAAAVVDGSGFSRRCRDNGLIERVDFQVRSACAPKKVAFRRPAR